MVAPIATLPRPRPGYVRNTNRVESMGRVALGRLAAEGEPIPANVARLDLRLLDEPPVPDKSDALLLALMVFNALDPEQKKRIRSTLATAGFAGGDPHAERLHGLLSLGCDL